MSLTSGTRGRRRTLVGLLGAVLLVVFAVVFVVVTTVGLVVWVIVRDPGTAE
ncbi:hypothetical protein HGA02_03835, partial [Cellulomonas septica]|nr:hypothetical protein [Cellulomonas septica]